MLSAAHAMDYTATDFITESLTVASEKHKVKKESILLVFRPIFPAQKVEKNMVDALKNELRIMSTKQ